MGNKPKGLYFKKTSCKYSGELTPAEKSLLALLMEGYEYKECAEILYISESTVKTHVNALFLKEQVHSRGELIAKKYKELLGLPPEKRVIDGHCAMCERAKIVFEKIYNQIFDYKHSGYLYARQHQNVARMMLRDYEKAGV